MQQLKIFLLLILAPTICIYAQFDEEERLENWIYGPTALEPADLDGDGDIDILCPAWQYNTLAWYRNDGTGKMKEKSVDYGSSVTSVLAIDLNQNGTIDVLAADYGEDKLIWYENEEPLGYNFNKIVISDEIKEPRTIHAADLDGDGNIDVIAGSTKSNTITWYRNQGDESFSDPIIISTKVNYPDDLYASDLDSDGDMDIVSASTNDNKIAWYENDGTGVFGNQKIISVNAKNARDVSVDDLDNDGDMDIVSASYKDNKIAWYRNNGKGEFSSEIVISTEVTRTVSVHIVDLNGDKDLDIIAGSIMDEQVVWFKNMGQGNFGPPNRLPSSYGSISYVTAADIDGDLDQDIIYCSTSGQNNELLLFRNSFNHNRIGAFCFNDINENGVHDENEPPIRNQTIFISPLDVDAVTNQNGNASFFLEYGDYQMTYQNNTLWELSSENESYEIDFSVDSNLPIYQFGFKPRRVLPRVEPHLNSSITRCNRIANYWLHYTNTGTTTANGNIMLEVDELLGFISSNPEPDFIEGTNLTWKISDLLPSFENKIQIQLQMPDFTAIGEMLETKTFVELFNDNEELVYSDSINYESELRCSYDPNDKLVRSNILGQSEFAEIGDTLTYTVRFQNTGNDTAFNVIIKDALDSNLEFQTFKPITASHDYYPTFNRATGQINFFFDNILLPDSTTNEPKSHGFVTFQVAMKKDLSKNAVIENTAYIYFDFNPPIITNTVLTELFEDVVSESSFHVSAYPNPFTHFTEIVIQNSFDLIENYHLELINIWGRKILTVDFPKGAQKLRLERGELESGVYLFKVSTDNDRVLKIGKLLID